MGPELTPRSRRRWSIARARTGGRRGWSGYPAGGLAAEGHHTDWLCSCIACYITTRPLFSANGALAWWTESASSPSTPPLALAPFLIIACFQASTLIAEALAAPAVIAMVKQTGIVVGLSP